MILRLAGVLAVLVIGAMLLCCEQKQSYTEGVALICALPKHADTSSPLAHLQWLKKNLKNEDALNDFQKMDGMNAEQRLTRLAEMVRKARLKKCELITELERRRDLTDEEPSRGAQ